MLLYLYKTILDERAKRRDSFFFFLAFGDYSNTRVLRQREHH